MRRRTVIFEYQLIDYYMKMMVIRCAKSSIGWDPPASGQTCPHSAQPDWRVLATHLPQDNHQEGRDEAIGHRVQHGARRQCAA